jgi:hypothetical protein
MLFLNATEKRGPLGKSGILTATAFEQTEDVLHSSVSLNATPTALLSYLILEINNTYYQLFRGDSFPGANMT